MHCRSNGPQWFPSGFSGEILDLAHLKTGRDFEGKDERDIGINFERDTRDFSDSLGTREPENRYKKSEPKFLRFPENEKPLLN